MNVFVCIATHFENAFWKICDVILKSGLKDLRFNVRYIFAAFILDTNNLTTIFYGLFIHDERSNFISARCLRHQIDSTCWPCREKLANGKIRYTLSRNSTANRKNRFYVN